MRTHLASLKDDFRKHARETAVFNVVPLPRMQRFCRSFAHAGEAIEPEAAMRDLMASAPYGFCSGKSVYGE